MEGGLCALVRFSIVYALDVRCVSMQFVLYRGYCVVVIPKMTICDAARKGEPMIYKLGKRVDSVLANFPNPLHNSTRIV